MFKASVRTSTYQIVQKKMYDCSASQQLQRAITFKGMNQSLINADYAVRGLLPIRAGQIQKEIELGSTIYPFTQLDYCSIGNPQAFGQLPISFFREVISLVLDPDNMHNTSMHEDVKRRAQHYVDMINKEGNNIGAYSNNMGYAFIRENVKRFIVRRDGIADNDASDQDSIFMSAGASDMISKVVAAIISGPNDGVMVPIPQYPLYSALLTLNDARFIPYYLHEQKGWDIDLKELQKQYQQAKGWFVKIKALTIINPGNPTGQVISYQTLQDIVKFCYDNQILILADEVYQENIYAPNKQFHSVRKVILESQFPYNMTQCVSFHSCSKGIIGECGFRGGYSEFLNFEPDVLRQFQKVKNIYKGANTVGQVLTDMMVDPPSLANGCSQETVDQYLKERNDIFNSLKDKAHLVTTALNQMTNITCQKSEGAMYAFPRVHFNQTAIDAATAKGYQVDQYYCLLALEKLGIVLVPGSGFKQQKNTYHFRITILIKPTSRLKESLEKFKDFNDWFHNEHP